MSGIDISDELLALYEEVKLRHKHKYFIFSLKQVGLDGNKTVWGWEINCKSEPVADEKNVEAFAEVVKQLPADEARFVVFDFTETKSDGRQIKKLLLIKWCPDTVNFKVKTVVGGTYQRLKEKLQGLGKDVQAVDTSDLEYNAIKAQLA